LEEKQNRFRGCLVGMAIGDAMGFSVDDKDLGKIQETYGPNGLLGYDLVNAAPCITSYAQSAAFAANGLIKAICDVRRAGALPYIEQALRDWARAQRYAHDPHDSMCWIGTDRRFRLRSNRDIWMLDAVENGTGTMEKPKNRRGTPGCLPVCATVGLMYHPPMQVADLLSLGARTAALTHGEPMAWLCGAWLAHCIAGLTNVPERSLQEQFRRSTQAVVDRFGDAVAQAREFEALLGDALNQRDGNPMEFMEHLGCNTAIECLQGAIYVSLQYEENFDEAMILAVNHSGRSSAVAAVAGAVLGARMGYDSLPEFYTQDLDVADRFGELADDLYIGSPSTGIFDMVWDQKYNK